MLNRHACNRFSLDQFIACKCIMHLNVFRLLDSCQFLNSISKLTFHSKSHHSTKSLFTCLVYASPYPQQLYLPSSMCAYQIKSRLFVVRGHIFTGVLIRYSNRTITGRIVKLFLKENLMPYVYDHYR